MKTPSETTDELEQQPALHAAGESDTHQRSLRSKIVLSLAAVFLIFLLVDQVVREHVIEPEFAALERVGAARDANRVLAAINAEIEHVADLAEQWASQIREMPLDELPRSGLRTQSLTWAVYADKQGSLDWLVRDESFSPSMNPDSVEDQIRGLLKTSHVYAGRTASGMARIGSSALVLYAVVAIDTEPNPAQQKPSSDNGARQSRFVVVGREMNGAMVHRLRRQTQVEFFLQSPHTANPNQRTVIWEQDASTLAVEIPLIGSHNRNLANIHIRVSRDIAGRAEETTSLARDSFIFGSLAALLILMLLLQRIVIGPLTAIREHSDLIAEEGLNTEPLVISGNDEIGQLGIAFDKMVNRLSDAQSQLTRASQAEGRSEVASTVIHNVGNVLTNVNSLLDAASSRVSGLRIGPLDMLADRLKDDSSDDGLLAATPDYLAGLAGSLKSDQQCIGEMLATLHDNIRHIHDVIRDQQRHAKQRVKTSRIELKDLIEEAIACSSARLDQDSVIVDVSGDLSLSIESDRSLLLQTVINVIGNAQNAMRDNDPESRFLRIEVEPRETTVCISFRDNGCGMSEETMSRVFDAHFTTRESGSGLGLHFCSITLKRLGGWVRVSSEGIGLGSTFEVELPLSSRVKHQKNMQHSPSTSALGAEQ